MINRKTGDRRSSIGLPKKINFGYNGGKKEIGGDREMTDFHIRLLKTWNH